ncbi:MAG: hypothetical protein VW405_21410 [Rhodospirillaceae bacterium]|jgi:hypothetical protein
MGLDTTHDCWHGAYSAFHRFRHGIARAIGLDLASMQGFSESTVTGQGRAGIAWSLLKPDPIHILLNHSDCEGEIAVPNLLPLAARLEELIPALAAIDGVEPGVGHLSSGLASAAKRFADGLRRAAAAGEAVEFR